MGIKLFAYVWVVRIKLRNYLMRRFSTAAAMYSFRISKYENEGNANFVLMTSAPKYKKKAKKKNPQIIKKKLGLTLVGVCTFCWVFEGKFSFFAFEFCRMRSKKDCGFIG